MSLCDKFRDVAYQLKHDSSVVVHKSWVSIVCRMRRQKAERAQQYRSRAYVDLKNRLAANVLRLRISYGWSQEEAAHNCGMSTRVLQRAESAEVNVTFTTLARFCEGFGVDIGELLRKR